MHLWTFSMICLAACDQFFSTNYRFNLRQMCTMKLARCFTVISICVWFLHSLIFGLYVNIESVAGCTISNQIWLRYATFFLLSSFWQVFFPLLSHQYSAYWPFAMFVVSSVDKYRLNVVDLIVRLLQWFCFVSYFLLSQRFLILLIASIQLILV